MNSDKGKLKALAVIIFLIILFFITFPLLLHTNRYIPGFYSSDEPFAVLQGFWWLKFSFTNHYQWTNEFVTAYPFGIQHVSPGFHPLWFHISKFISIISNWILAYNLPVICNFIISFISIFYLFYFLTRDILISFFVGTIYALCPYQFSRFWQHFALTFTGFIPLYILFLIKLHGNRTFKNAFFSVLIFALIISFELHYAFFMLLATFLFMFYTFIYRQERKRAALSRIYFMVIVLIALTSIVILYRSFLAGLAFAPKTVIPGAFAVIRPFEDLFTQSAKPLSYLLPAVVHPLFGKFTEQFIGSPLYGESITEHTLYLGWVPLILAFIGARSYFKKRKEDGGKFYIGFFIILAIVAWIFSQPPWWKIGAVKIYMPSFFIYKIIPIFRAYCRFGILVMFAVAILAGFGLRSVLERFNSVKSKVGITVLFCALVLFEFWNWPPYKVIDVSRVPEVYYWLKGQPKDTAIAEYPIDTNGASEWYKLYQTMHEKSMINGTIPGTYPNRIARSITKLSAQETAAALAWLGVKYVLLNKESYLKTELVEDIDELNKIPKNSGLKFIKSFPLQDCPKENIACTEATGPIDVYEVVASGVKPTVKQE